MPLKVPLAHPEPDAKRFIRILSGSERGGRVPLVEYLVDDTIMKPVVTEILGRSWADYGTSRQTQAVYLDNVIAFWLRMGYDAVRFELGLPFTERRIFASDPTSVAGGRRSWADEHHGAIQSREDFDRYVWPRIEDADFFPFEYIDRHLPEGMGLIACHAGGVFEHLSWIMSYEGLCLALKDNPQLVGAVADRIGELMTEFYRHLVDLDNIVAVFPGDDMGFKTGTLVSPADLRAHILPWHRQFARMAHDRGLPYFLHSCGNLESILDDLVESVRIDGKHSFEDAILPVQDFQARYGDRVAALGGVDVSVLAAGSEGEVRKRTRDLIETCGARGRYAVGSGNSIPSYVPLANYLAMVDEALGD